ncbi:MAG: VOC family protein [Pseudomonadota bacterium]
MAKALAFGGIFVRAQDPKALINWYQQHLDIDLSQGAWMQDGGPTVFAAFARDDTYFGRSEQQWMLNFRVDDLTGLLDQLRSAGIDVETRAEWDSEIGRFARIHDPEGNPVELWEPGPSIPT